MASSRYVSNYTIGMTPTIPNSSSSHQLSMSVMTSGASQQTLKGNQPEFHVQQCLIPQSHQATQFRILHQRAEYHMSNQAGVYSNQSVSQQPQGTTIRGMQPNAPSTPPQQDIGKMPGQQSMPMHNYAPGTGRGQNTPMYRPSQTPNQTRVPRAAMIPYAHIPPPHIVLNPQYGGPQFAISQTRPNQPPIYTSNTPFTTQFPYNININPYYPIPTMTRPIGTQNLANNSGNTLTMAPNVNNLHQQQQPGIPHQRKRRTHALAVIDSTSGKDVLKEVLGEESISSLQTGTMGFSNIANEGEYEHSDLSSQYDSILQTDPSLIGLNNLDIVHQPPQTIIIQDSIALEPPVVSAQTDGPSIEIQPKQPNMCNRKRKPLDMSDGDSSRVLVTQNNVSHPLHEAIPVVSALTSGGMQTIQTKVIQIPSHSVPIQDNVDSDYIYMSGEHETSSTATNMNPEIGSNSAIKYQNIDSIILSSVNEYSDNSKSDICNPQTSSPAQPQHQTRQQNQTAEYFGNQQEVSLITPSLSSLNINNNRSNNSACKSEEFENNTSMPTKEISVHEEDIDVSTCSNTLLNESPQNNLLLPRPEQQVDTPTNNIKSNAGNKTNLMAVEPSTQLQYDETNNNKNFAEETKEIQNDSFNIYNEKENSIVTRDIKNIETCLTNISTIDPNCNLNNDILDAMLISNNTMEILNKVENPDSNNSPSPSKLDKPEITETVTENILNNNVISDDSDKANSFKQISIEYDEGQWSPANPSGKKAYTLDQLKKLMDVSYCKAKPTNLKLDDHEVLLDSIRLPNSRNDLQHNFICKQYMGGNNMRGNDNLFWPTFAQSGPCSRGGQLPGKRNMSQQGNKQQQGGKSKSGGVIHVALSLREDVKLNETENAWKPTHLVETDSMSREERAQQELNKRVRGILNKLTPEKFTQLIGQMKQLTINTADKLNSVIELIFEKAVDEPNFAVAYAQMCHNLSFLTIPEAPGSTNTLIFQKILLSHCQSQFEGIAKIGRNDYKKKLQECKDPEKRLELEEEERKMRRRSVGTIRFIGELYKFEMLTVKIMMNCINHLLQRKTEESLECLCKLLTTVGLQLSTQIDKTPLTSAFRYQLPELFDEIAAVVANKSFKISSRVRFMMQDVIDLKKSSWIPRRQDLNPKKMGEIQKEAETEALNIQLMNYHPATRKDDRRGGGGGSGGGGNMNNNNNNSYSGGFLSGRSSDDGWSVQTSKNRSSSSTFSNIDPKKLTTTNKNFTQSTMLGTASSYKWTPKPPETQIANKFSPLLPDKKSGTFGGNKNKEPYHSKGSLERYDRNSQSRIRDSSFSRNHSHESNQYSDASNHSNTNSSNNNTIHPRNDRPELNTGIQPTRPITNVEDLPEPSEEIINQMSKFTIYEEYFVGTGKLEDCIAQIESISEEYRWCLARVLYNHTLEKKRLHRVGISEVFVFAINKYNVIKLEHFLRGLREHLDLMEEYRMDYPMIWEYVSDILWPLLKNKVINFLDLKSVAKVPIEDNCGRIMIRKIFEQLLVEYGKNCVYNLWTESNCKFSDFMPDDWVDEFIEVNELEYVHIIDATPPPPVRRFDAAGVKEKLNKFLVNNTPYDDITDWINSAYVMHDHKTTFVRILTTAIFEYCLEPFGNSYKLNKTLLDAQGFKLLRRYIENNENRELQCLYAIQKIIHGLDYPAGLLRAIVEALYEQDIISIDGFMKWKETEDPKELEGRGVCLRSIVSFYTSLNEPSSDENADTPEKSRN